MMQSFQVVTVCFVLFSGLFVSGCSTDDNKKSDKTNGEKQITQEEMRLSGGWVRPGSQHGNSAAYLSINNNTTAADTIQRVTAGAAKEAEIHESFKGENGISGMRPAAHLIIKSGEDLYLQPGGLHVMLMELDHDLAEGDSVNITITFERSGSRSIRLPVKTEP